MPGASTLTFQEGLRGLLQETKEWDPGRAWLVYNTESGFFNPAFAELNAGLADFGTRLRAVFNNVPSGVRLFAATTVLRACSRLDRPQRTAVGVRPGHLTPGADLGGRRHRRLDARQVRHSRRIYLRPARDFHHADQSQRQLRTGRPRHDPELRRHPPAPRGQDRRSLPSAGDPQVQRERDHLRRHDRPQGTGDRRRRAHCTGSRGNGRRQAPHQEAGAIRSPASPSPAQGSSPTRDPPQRGDPPSAGPRSSSARDTHDHRQAAQGPDYPLPAFSPAAPAPAAPARAADAHPPARAPR